MESPFLQGPPGQTFTSTLLLSFSYTPLLRSQATPLRTFDRTNKELALLEPILAEAWDRWGHTSFFLYTQPAYSYLIRLRHQPATLFSLSSAFFPLFTTS